MKLCILGGGGFRTPFVYQALLRDAGGPGVEQVWLYDTDADRLRVMRLVLDELAAGFPHPPRVVPTGSLRDAVSGADFVFAAIRVGGLAGRVSDERVATDLGVLGQETTGPGGIAFALRTVPVMVEIAETVRELAPDAYVMNFTNPAGIITEAMSAVLGDRVVGICDTPSGLGRRIAASLSVDPAAVQLDYVGLNHLGWMRRMRHRGEDILPRLLADDAALAELEEGSVFGPEWLRTIRCIPNEYLYYYYFNRDAVRAIRESTATRGEFLERTQTKFFRGVLRSGDSAAQRWRAAVNDRHASYMAEARTTAEARAARRPAVAEPENDPDQQGYAGVALAVMAAISTKHGSAAILNVRNGPTITALPPDAVIEVPCTVDAAGAHPLATDPPDAHQLGLMSSVKAVEQHTIAAALTGSKSEALQAFALHPLVDSVTVARRLLDGYLAGSPQLRAVLAR